MLDDSEGNGLGEGAGLSNSDLISGADKEGRGAMSRNLLVTLLETGVLLDEVKVVTTDSDGTVHLGGRNNTLDDASTNSDSSGEWALLINVLSCEAIIYH